MKAINGIYLNSWILEWRIGISNFEESVSLAAKKHKIHFLSFKFEHNLSKNSLCLLDPSTNFEKKKGIRFFDNPALDQGD